MQPRIVNLKYWAGLLTLACACETSTGVTIVAPRRTLELRWSEPMAVLVRRDVSNCPTLLNDPSIRQHFVTNSRRTQPAGYQVYLEVMAEQGSVEARSGTAEFVLPPASFTTLASVSSLHAADQSNLQRGR